MEMASGTELGLKKVTRGKDRGISFSSDGRWLASALRDGVRVWDVATGNPLAARPPSVGRPFGPDDQSLVISGNGGVARLPF